MCTRSILHECARREAHPGQAIAGFIDPLTGYDQAEDKQRTQEVGFDEPLLRPLDLLLRQRALAVTSSNSDHPQLGSLRRKKSASGAASSYLNGHRNFMQS